MASYREMEKMAAEMLERAGVPDADYDAGVLLRFAAGMDRTGYLLHREEPVPGNVAVKFLEMARRRAERIPLQHILGEAWFMGLPFFVSEDVLIPRQDTETLVCAVLDDRKEHAGGSLLDLCTGSGCIAVSLAALGHFDAVTASDLSEAALAVARKNAERNLKAGWEIRSYTRSGEDGNFEEKTAGRRMDLVCCDLFSGLGGRRFDVITANPPYIPDGRIEGLMPEVRDHDPRLALAGGADGLDFYRRIAGESPAHLRRDAGIYLEIGAEQAREVTELLEAAGFRDIRIIRDDAGNDRVAAARAPENRGSGTENG